MGKILDPLYDQEQNDLQETLNFDDGDNVSYDEDFSELGIKN